MTPLFKKMNYKDQEAIIVLNAPGSFDTEKKAMTQTTEVLDSLKGLKALPFFIAFVTKQQEVDALAKQVGKLAKGDEVIWFAYPKGTSKKYTCDFNRDTGWAELGRQGFEGVRMVAIDEDWSALRFRRVENIKTMTRSFAMTDKGKQKASKTAKKKGRSA
jgi:hypothetical protein